MNDLKIKVVGLKGEGISELYLYYLDNEENIVAILAVNSQGDLICYILDSNYEKEISENINKIIGFEMGIEEEYYITGNEVVWENTKKFISEKNLEMTYRKPLDNENDETLKM